MNWLQREPAPLAVRTAVPLPEPVGTEPVQACPACHALLSVTVLQLNQQVCPACDEHLKMSARSRLNQLFDGQGRELGQHLRSSDPLHFVDSKPYPQRLAAACQQTGETEALIVMQGRVQGSRASMNMVACAFEFDFLGGSMGSVVGDRFVLACDAALEQRLPLVCFAASGGARMQEGLLSLMQMARTSAAIQRLRRASLPYVVVLTHPVYGGVTASLAMLGDVHLAEPKAMIGFAGKRVIEQTVREVLDEPFQRAEYLLEHGVIDQIVHRHALKDTLVRILSKLAPAQD